MIGGSGVVGMGLRLSGAVDEMRREAINHIRSLETRHVGICSRCIYSPATIVRSSLPPSHHARTTT